MVCQSDYREYTTVTVVLFLMRHYGDSELLLLLLVA